MGRVCVSLCRCFVFVSVVHPVAILNAVFCVICSFLMCVSDASGDHMVETYSSKGLVMALYVAMIISFCFPHVVDFHCLVLHIIVHLHTSFYYVHCSFFLIQHIQCPHPSSPHQVIAFTLKKHMDLCFFCTTHTEIIIIFPFHSFRTSYRKATSSDH